MKIYGIILAASLGIMVAGCSTLIPSRYDDNESYVAVNLYHEVNKLDCSDDIGVIYQSRVIDNEVDWLKHYTELKNSKDIQAMIDLMKETTGPFAKRDQISQPYCELKKRAMMEQSRFIAKAIMARMK